MFTCITAQGDKNREERHETRMLSVPLPSGSFVHPTLVVLCRSGGRSMERSVAIGYGQENDVESNGREAREQTMYALMFERNRCNSSILHVRLIHTPCRPCGTSRTIVCSVVVRIDWSDIG